VADLQLQTSAAALELETDVAALELEMNTPALELETTPNLEMETDVPSGTTEAGEVFGC
jgi:hypothetical protein